MSHPIAAHEAHYYRAVIEGEHVGTEIQGKCCGSVSVFAPTAAEMDVILEQTDYPGTWHATAYRVITDPSKPVGQRYVREELYRAIGQVDAIHTNGSGA